MNKILVIIMSTLILCGLNGCKTSQPSGDASPKILVCFGDSLTSCGEEGGRYSDMLQNDFPNWQVINSGKGGDTIGGGLARLQEDVLAHQPDYAVIGLGANDYWMRSRTLNDLRKDYESIVSQCTEAGIKVCLISCFGTNFSDQPLPQDQTGLSLEDYAAGLAQIEHELVKKYNCTYVPDMQVNITPKGRTDLWSDSNHPNAAGNRIVADTILPELKKLIK